MLLLDHRLRRRLALDHHEAGLVQELLRVDARLFRARLWRTLLFHARFFGAGLGLLVALRFVVADLLRAGLELMNATLLLGERSGGGRVLVARTLSAALPSVAIAVASAAVAPPAAMLFAFAFGPRSLSFGCKLMKLRSLAARSGLLRRLRGPRRLSLLWRALLSALTPVRTRSPLTSPVGPTILALALAIAVLRLPIPAALFEAAMLLTIAATTFAPTVSPAVATTLAPLIPVPALLLVATRLALLLLRLRGSGRWRGRRSGSLLEEAE